MIHNAPIKKLTHGRFSIEGYSRAAVQTYWRVPELKLGFDLGAQPWSFMGTPTWFISHTHMDHLVALPVYVARRRMMKMEPPVIHLPEAAVEPTAPEAPVETEPVAAPVEEPVVPVAEPVVSPEAAAADTMAAAEAIVAEYQPGDLIWIHDYHLIPLALAAAAGRRPPCSC